MSEETETLRRRLPALLAAVGLLFSGALEVVHFRAHLQPSASSFCTAGAHFDCNVVALSRWSVVFGIPVPLWGVAGFLAMGLLAWWHSRWLLPLSALGALASAALLWVELFRIHNVCLLCEGVHVVSWALFAVVWLDRKSLTETEGITLVHLFTVPLGILVIAHNLLEPYWTLFSWKNGVHLPHAVDAEGHYWIGAEEPKVTLHEYTDYSCAHCAAATNRVRRLTMEYPSALRVVHHNYPRMRCPREAGPETCMYVRAANCAGDQGKFWEMDSWLFAHSPAESKVDLDSAARELSLDPAKLSACVESPASYTRADAEVMAASRAHVVDAPSYLIDGKRYVGGAVFPELARRL